MLKKSKIVTIILIFVIALAGCTVSSDVQNGTHEKSPSDTAQEIVNELKDGDVNSQEIEYVGICFPMLNEPWFVVVKDEIVSILEDAGIEVEIASSDNDHAKQLEIIENFGNKGVDGLILFPIGASEIGDTLEGLQKQGMRIIVFINEIDKGFDGIFLTDYREQGEQCAKMAAKWIDETYPDAEPGSVEVGVLSINMSVEAKAVSDGMRNIESYTDKARIVVDYEASFDDAETKAQENAELMLVNYPDVKCIMTYNHPLSVDEAIMRAQGIDLSTFGVFTNTYDESVTERIVMSKTNESVIRGNSISGTGHYYDIARALLGQIEFDANGVYYEPITTITAENVENFLP